MYVHTYIHTISIINALILMHILIPTSWKF